MGDTGGGHRASAEAIKAMHSTKNMIIPLGHLTNCLELQLLGETRWPKGLMKYQPDIIISVHPLMAKGLLKKIVFTNPVITDLSTCHPTCKGFGLHVSDHPLYVKPVSPRLVESGPLVICGIIKSSRNRLLSIDWKIPVQIKGFVTKMEECMGACDCIITKAGPGTIAEAMIRGLPIILNDYIAGQEAGNVPYVVENGFGKFSKSPKEIA
ncbi:hypothetical protein LOK49_LG15G00978 [Camellia lanceoleosa]|uniref:Uncharacterized protein n=1 Tax=Camellia lanceoleosa TaxID=1840588 RepID=A0ACC0F636_9ERIC|nr:hypothetical protein LOK49_LG15G00978 [Camellia lanceoleosa]